MPKVFAVIVGEGVAVDAFTGRITAFNMLDSLFVPKLPGILPRLHVVVCAQKDGPTEEHYAERMSLTAPTGKVVAENSVEIAFASKFHTTLHNVWGVRLDEAGDYSIEIQHRPPGTDAWASVMKRPLEVKLQAHPLSAPQIAPEDPPAARSGKSPDQ